MISESQLQVMERGGSDETQRLCAQVRRLREGSRAIPVKVYIVAADMFSTNPVIPVGQNHGVFSNKEAAEEYIRRESGGNPLWHCEEWEVEDGA